MAGPKTPENGGNTIDRLDQVLRSLQMLIIVFIVATGSLCLFMVLVLYQLRVTPATVQNDLEQRADVATAMRQKDCESLESQLGEINKTLTRRTSENAAEHKDRLENLNIILKCLQEIKNKHPDLKLPDVPDNFTTYQPGDN